MSICQSFSSSSGTGNCRSLCSISYSVTTSCIQYSLNNSHLSVSCSGRFQVRPPLLFCRFTRHTKIPNERFTNSHFPLVLRQANRFSRSSQTSGISAIQTVHHSTAPLLQGCFYPCPIQTVPFKSCIISMLDDAWVSQCCVQAYTFFVKSFLLFIQKELPAPCEAFCLSDQEALPARHHICKPAKGF